MADQLFIFGGVTAAGPVNDLWAYNLVTLTWAQVAQSGSIPPSLGAPAGLFIGRWLYVYSGSNTNNGLWRWTSSTGGPPPQAASSTISTAGLTAAAVISILLLLTTTTFSFIVFRRTGGFAKVCSRGVQPSMPPSDIYATLDMVDKA